MGCLAQRSCFLQNGILNLKSCFMFIQWIISEQVLVMCWGYSGQKERPVPCPQEFAFHWGLEKGSRNKWMMIIWECNQSYEGCARGSLEVAVGNCLRVVCVRGQESSRGDVKSERSQLFEQEGQEHLSLRGLRVPYLDMERANWRSVWLRLSNWGRVVRPNHVGPFVHDKEIRFFFF